MNKEINTIIANLEGCIGMFDYLLTPTESNLLVSYIEELQQENKDKINWYENFEINKTIDKLRIKHNNQQKEFIEWLEAMSKMYENEYKDIDIAGHYNCVLTKYKEIIGGNKDE